MTATLIIGGQWGDEGKAKVVDFLMSAHDVVIRFQGGSNAGHTVVTDAGRFAFHQIPSGLLYPHVSGIMGNGMVVDPFAFLDELNDLMSKGVDVDGRLFISSAAQIVMPYHKILDNLYESERGQKSIGSTGKGIGPTYADKHSRRGLRMGCFNLEKSELFAQVESCVDRNNKLLEMFKAPPLSPRKVASDFVNIKDLIAHFIVDTQEMIYKLGKGGKKLLFEGAQGTLLDIDHGTYPYVTSSSCTAGGMCIGTGVSPKSIGRVIGILKAYTTRVGNGPFPTELEGEEGDYLRDQGHEYGTTTGRPRRCGWFDLVAARYSVHLNGLSEIALTKLDVLSGLTKLKLCTGYEIDGETITHFPQNSGLFDRCEPVYEEMPGWGKDEITSSSFDELPENARRYIERIEELIEVKVSFISTGPARSETIIRDSSYSFDSREPAY